MSSHVVVIDSTARRATVKTTPGKHLTDVLQEACTKLGVDASQYGLKHKSKQLDLSLAFRLSGLSSGAKLELVQLSRSPSVVTVGLQLPESEARGAPNGRILDKFPSTTTLWFILRKFEAGVAGTGATRNLTGRGVPSTDGKTGSGRILYEMPVLQIMERELSTFTDLQKSLAQLGFNGGSILLRLSFRRTEEPIEEAMAKIQEYFRSLGEDVPKTQEPPAPTPVQQAPPEIVSSQPTDQPASSVSEETTQTPSVPEPSENPPPASTSIEPSAPAGTTRPVTVFSPPTNNTPQSAQMSYNENDYVPTVDHAKAHQKLLNTGSKNVRLPSDAEIAAKEEAEKERLAGIKEVDVKIRLPDQSQVVAKFGQDDTGKGLYSFVRSCLAEPFVGEKFILTQFASPAVKVKNTIPDSDQSLLIKHVGLVGRVLLNFSWDESTSSAARTAKANLLKPELRSQAQEIKVEQPADVMDTSEDTEKPKTGLGTSDGGKPSTRKTGGMPKWLKLPGKK
ncbi:hypothetical protein ASPWEDRAFT_34603 [Aspergillus wentii DTO 134E9]|uniref:UBX domain-containing protein n=1 Tax=Aspergillus wentii DTO 134E9 TaxID=1073089 RepID=A0A1L9S1T7_ASPWE|nr:uncharacterized protein ASPWEDRAFT_34603 [Aspergillus wentii DTO 134E9]KAI9930899.1 hypothetical protein MW887_010550 [Aspergillus wentii]OJJ41113.1 hypothetical protein ASPWEDRAFT_34603 [Aspergillus wentii DTO 134E9]